MQCRCLWLVLVVVSVATAACTSEVTSACADLAALNMTDVSVTSSDEVAAADGVPGHCSVNGMIDGRIRFALLLPDDWNGRFVMGGGGGFVGTVQNQAQPFALAQGYATVGTDTGHSGTGIEAGWALENSEAEIDFGHRAVHRTADTAKNLIRDYYDGDIAHSYFFGCSRGGGQGMMQSQRYPADFDGIVVGAPAYDWPGLGAGFIQTQQKIYPDPHDLAAPVISAETRHLLQSEILNQCDALDGVEDGVMEDPRRCSFGTDSLPQCPGGVAGPDCVTAAQLEAINAVYDGPTVDGEQVFAGFPFGGEAEPEGWGSWITGGEGANGPGAPSLHYAFGTEMYKYLVFDDPNWDYTSYDFSTYESDIASAAEILNATDTDLTHFKSNDGKMIMWQGWSDAAITALGTIDYYEGVEAGDPDVRDYARLFMMPGVLHCSGGPGPDDVDWLAAITHWVERDTAPGELLATKFDENRTAVRTRPLCPYPMVAAYTGSGNTDDAANFECVEP